MRFVVREIKIACPNCGETCDIHPELMALISSEPAAPLAQPTGPMRYTKSLKSAPSTSAAQTERRAAARAYQKAYYRKKVKKAAKARKAKQDKKEAS